MESWFAQSYRWYESVDCLATIMKDMKIIDWLEIYGCACRSIKRLLIRS
jgi:hypothetical protein